MSTKQIGSLFMSLSGAATPTAAITEAAQTLAEGFGTLGSNQEALKTAVTEHRGDFLAFKLEASNAVNINTKAISDLATETRAKFGEVKTGMDAFVAKSEQIQKENVSRLAALEQHNKEWKPMDIFNAIGSGLSIGSSALAVGGALALASSKPNNRGPNNP